MIKITKRKKRKKWMPKVWNIWDPKCPARAVLIDRTTKWGNHFIIGQDGTRSDVIRKHKLWVRRHPQFRDEVIAELRGKHLKCHCPPKKCHGDYILWLANKTYMRHEVSFPMVREMGMKANKENA